MRVNFVVATRLNEEVFWRDSLAGQFFRIFDVGSGEVKLFPKNTIGLSKIYDSALDDYRHSGEVTVFMHDDLLVLDGPLRHDRLPAPRRLAPQAGGSRSQRG